MIDNPFKETITGLGSAWADAKKSFAPVVESAKENLKEVIPSIKSASKQVLSNAKDSAIIAINNLAKEDGKGIKLLGQSAGLLAVNYGLSSFSNWVGLHPGPNTAGVDALFAVTGLLNGGVAAFTADKSVKFYNHMKSLKSK